LPNNIEVIRQYNNLTFRYREFRDSFTLIKGMQKFKETTMSIDEYLELKKENNFNELCTNFFDYDRINRSLEYRVRRKGDYIVIDNEGHRKTINKFMTDSKIPILKRDSMLMFCDGYSVVWVPGYRIGEIYRITDETKNVLRIDIEE